MYYVDHQTTEYLLLLSLSVSAVPSRAVLEALRYLMLRSFGFYTSKSTLPRPGTHMTSLDVRFPPRTRRIANSLRSPLPVTRTLHEDHDLSLLWAKGTGSRTSFVIPHHWPLERGRCALKQHKVLLIKRFTSRLSSEIFHRWLLFGYLGR
jgi:hypothetical protein